ncbi:MAG: hypothetical protein FIA97_16375 [Methylococcaceae bacterium]|nr:hypothetical protein [Methylococcaceae bacterium]
MTATDAEFQRALAQARRWALEAEADGWLSGDAVAPLLDLGDRTPAKLFDAATHRPLVAAFFGGTGVGKSSLLNRLAGNAIARVGVERPTSREISLFHHESLHLRQLPEVFPVDRVRAALHRDERRRQVLWIDMPDIDSTATDNRDLVLSWLPHIDVLIYVVSPERYRDDKGWRLLREQGCSHAWLFVINQWDRGHPDQLEDFRALLKQGGFAEPVLLRTCCRDGEPEPDDFAELEGLIQSLADHHVVEQLERRAVMLKGRELATLTRGLVARLGSASAWESLDRSWSEVFATARTTLEQGLEWPIREIARNYVRSEANPLQKSADLARPERPSGSPAPSLLWDDWAAMQLEDAIDRMLLEADSPALLAKLRGAFDDCQARAGRLLHSQAQLQLRQALANPGNGFHRLLLRLTGIAAILLPLAAIGWVSWLAVSAYYASAVNHAGFLGLDFAIHSGLLVIMAWLLPYFLNLRLRPSTERVAATGLRRGVAAGLDLIETEVADAIARVRAEWRQRVDEAERLLSGMPQGDGMPETALVGRMVPNMTAAVRED